MIGAYLFLSFAKESRRPNIKFIERMLTAFERSLHPFFKTDIMASVTLPSFCWLCIIAGWFLQNSTSRANALCFSSFCADALYIAYVLLNWFVLKMPFWLSEREMLMSIKTVKTPVSMSMLLPAAVWNRMSWRSWIRPRNCKLFWHAVLRWFVIKST